MKIALLHYHLNRGGVTQVIANHLRALNRVTSPGANLQVALLFGGRCDGWSDRLTSELDRLTLTMYPMAELDYDNVGGARGDLNQKLLATFREAGFPPEETVVHIHNHSLGKNKAVPGAMNRLAREGYSCLMQIHDFAEDFRPDNYHRIGSSEGATGSNESAGFLYPQASQIHYAVLNSRDHSILLDAGVDLSRLHVLPNAVAEFDTLPPHDEARARVAERFGISSRERFILYPVRGIRRKNLGEALLWSALAKGRNCFGLTLPPLNPVEQPSYARWKECANDNGLRWMFEMGGVKGLDYMDNLAAADFILTTSVAEGFGLVFLEAWLANCHLVGRDLPEITNDFLTMGMRFPGLNPEFWIPVELLDQRVARGEMADSFRSVLRSYRLPEPDSLDQEMDGLFANDRLDFARCGISTQRQVINKVASESAFRNVVLAANPWFDHALTSTFADSELIGKNAEIVSRQYSLTQCGRRLTAIYDKVVSSDRDDKLKPLSNRNRILGHFLSLTRFHPLRIET